MRRPRMRKEAVRIAQEKPTAVTSRLIMMGKITPPREDPDAMTPKARARFLWNQVPTLFMAG